MSLPKILAIFPEVKIKDGRQPYFEKLSFEPGHQ